MTVAEALDESEFQPYLGYVHDGPYRERAEEADITLVKYADTDDIKNVRKILEHIKAVYSLVDTIRELNIDVIHSNHIFSYVIASAAAAVTGVAHVRTQGNLMQQHEQLHARYFRLFPFSNFTDQYICLLETQVGELSDLGVPDRKLELIYPGVDLDVFSPERSGDAFRDEVGIDSDVPVVGIVSRIVKDRGFEMMIDAAPDILVDHPQTKFLFVGDGPLLDDLKQAVKRRGLEEYFVFPGYRTDPENAIAALDIASLTPTDPCGSSFLRESMASGVPIITTDGASGSQRTFVTPGKNGCLIPPEDVDALASTVRELLDNPERARKIGQNARRYAENHFSEEQMIAEHERLYANLAKYGGRRSFR